MVGSEGKRKGEKEEGGRHFFDDQAKTCRGREERGGRGCMKERKRKGFPSTIFWSPVRRDVTAGVKKPPAKA